MTILGVMILKIEQTILDDIDDAYYQNTKHFSGPKKLTQFKLYLEEYMLTQNLSNTLFIKI